MHQLCCFFFFFNKILPFKKKHADRWIPMAFELYMIFFMKWSLLLNVLLDFCYCCEPNQYIVPCKNLSHQVFSLWEFLHITSIVLIQIGVLIEDKDFVDSLMNGMPWKAGKFTLSLRLSLWSEHLGLHPGEVSRVEQACIFLRSLISVFNLKMWFLFPKKGLKDAAYFQLASL